MKNFLKTIWKTSFDLDTLETIAKWVVTISTFGMIFITSQKPKGEEATLTQMVCGGILWCAFIIGLFYVAMRRR